MYKETRRNIQLTYVQKYVNIEVREGFVERPLCVCQVAASTEPSRDVLYRVHADR